MGVLLNDAMTRRDDATSFLWFIRVLNLIHIKSPGIGRHGLRLLRFAPPEAWPTPNTSKISEKLIFRDVMFVASNSMSRQKPLNRVASSRHIECLQIAGQRNGKLLSLACLLYQSSTRIRVSVFMAIKRMTISRKDTSPKNYSAK